MNMARTENRTLLPHRYPWLRKIWLERQLWIICIPLLLWVAIFSYYPMYGLVYSFFNYKPGMNILTSQFVGFQWFIQFATSPDFFRIMRNTLAISGLNILFGFPAPIILALLINEVFSTRIKKVFQTISYLPYFISWVVVANILFTTLGNDGVVNRLLVDLGVTAEPIQFLGIGEYFWWILTFANIWKNVGWAAVIYISAIAGIDSQLYEAGVIDGLGRFGLIRHITIPGILPTILLLWILGIGGILNAGFEQQLLIGNPMTMDYYDVIDTYVYRYGVQLGRYSFSIAISLMKSVIGLGLVILTNRIARRRLGMAIY
jgi:putative aldouronate transport system permease protein